MAYCFSLACSACARREEADGPGVEGQFPRGALAALREGRGRIRLEPTTCAALDEIAGFTAVPGAELEHWLGVYPLQD